MKRITILLALTLVVALSMPATAEVEEITVGGSIIVQGEFQDPAGKSFNDDDPSQAWYSQRTRLNVDAALSGGVRAFVELQSYDAWGGGNPGVGLYQAYIDMNDIADYPVMLRIGRQELSYGREYLVGNNDAGRNFSGLSFDAIKVVYTEEDFQIDAWTAKQFEDGPAVTGQDEDIDFYGVYGTYTGIENTTLDAYLLLLRDGGTGGENDYLYTLGSRAAGIVDIGAGAIDYNAEVALQFGDTTADGDYEAWTLNLMAGYTFTDVEYSPRLEAEYAYFSGDDEVDKDTETFTRLFSDVHYGELNIGGALDATTTNLHILRLGGSAVPVEKLTVSADFLLFQLAEDDGAGDDALGYELDIVVDYQYTEDLNLRVGWAHFFADDVIENATGGNDDDIDYLFVQAALDF